MVKIINICFILLIFGISGCGISVKTQISENRPVLDYRERVVVYNLEDKVPEGYNIIGKVFLGYKAFTIKCDYYYLVETAKLEARKMGGNAIKIDYHKPPNSLNSCHKITAEVLYKSE